ncbi:MAG: T9SS type A sorting domain-containing protein [Flavobacteriales bacterium]|nr:T9SS type A sorting domain-containing protein [Flavobacteriales bacterium]
MKTFLTLILVGSTIVIKAQVIRYVRVGGTGDGSAWQFASGDLQNAINASALGDEVWVGAGEYKPTSPITDPLNLGGETVNKFSTFTMKSGVKVYGSFPPTGFPTLNDRNFTDHASILSGDIGVVGEKTDNCFHVCFFPNTENVLIDGFVIKDGFANGNTNTNNQFTDVSYLGEDIPNYQGAGIFMIGGSNRFENCTFINNQSIREGGAVFINQGNHEFLNNNFIENLARSGGGAVYCIDGEHNFHSNSFEGNVVQLGISYPFPMISPTDFANGAGIYSKNADLNIVSNVFESNEALVPNNVKNAQGGALYFSTGTLNLADCEFKFNSATFQPTGVQVCMGGAAYILQANSTIKNNTFKGNLSHGSGGAVQLSEGIHLLSSNRFTENESVGNGGALSAESANLSIINSIFDKNISAGYGAAIFYNGTSAQNQFVNNTYYKNSSSNTAGSAGIYMNGGVHQILNSIFFENKINNSSTAPGADVRYFNFSSSSTFQYNLYQTGSSDTTIGNIGFDGNNNPLFVDAENGNFALLPLSPCINTGNNDFYLTVYDSTDFMGNTRIDEGIIDRGAIENQGEIEPVTINKYHVPTHLTVFPNPVHSGQWLTVETGVFQSFKIVDIFGKQLMSGTLSEGSNSLNIEQLVPGFYVLQTLTNSVNFIKK